MTIGNKIIGFRVTPAQESRLKEAANQLAAPMSEIVREALDDYLNQLGVPQAYTKPIPGQLSME